MRVSKKSPGPSTRSPIPCVSKATPIPFPSAPRVFTAIGSFLQPAALPCWSCFPPASACRASACPSPATPTARAHRLQRDRGGPRPQPPRRYCHPERTGRDGRAGKAPDPHRHRLSRQTTPSPQSPAPSSSGRNGSAPNPPDPPRASRFPSLPPIS